MEHPPQHSNPESPKPNDLSTLIDTITKQRFKIQEDYARGLPADSEAIDLLGKTAFSGAREALLKTLVEARHLTSQEAQLFASIVLCRHFDTKAELCLEAFVVSGDGSVAELYTALAHARREIMPGILALIHDQLATYFVDAFIKSDRQPVRSRLPDAALLFPSLPGPELRPVAIASAFSASFTRDTAAEEDFAQDLIAAVFEHGEPLRAYLRIPGVDAAAPTLIDDLKRRYLGSVSSIPDLLHPDLPQAFEAIDLGGTIHLFASK